MDVEPNLENASAPGETDGQTQVCQSSVARPGAAIATPVADASAEGSPATGARDEGLAKTGIAQVAEPPVQAEKNSRTGKTGGDHEAGDLSAAVASFNGAAVDPHREALAALDDRDYATAQRLFTAIGRKDVADAIKDALAALDRKDYAKAHGLLEALHQKGAAAAQANGSGPDSPAPPKPATSAGGPMASDPRNRAQKPVASLFEVSPIAEAAYRRPFAQPERAKSRRLKPLLAGTGLALLAIFGVSAIYGSPLRWTFPTTASEALASLSSAAGALKADLAAITGQGGRETGQSAMPDLSAALTQQTARLDQIEHELGARLDRLSERNQESSSRFADMAARVDKLEKKAAVPATPSPESADVAARLDKLEKKVALAGAPASEIAALTTRLNKLEKKAAVAGANSTNRLSPTAPKQSALNARSEPSGSNETARFADRGPLLRDYSVENVRDGVAVVDSRYGQQEVTPGNSIPGAGRVLRIERRGGDWFVLTSRGLIASGPGP